MDGRCMFTHDGSLLLFPFSVGSQRTSGRVQLEEDLIKQTQPVVEAFSTSCEEFCCPAANSRFIQRLICHGTTGRLVAPVHGVACLACHSVVLMHLDVSGRETLYTHSSSTAVQLPVSLQKSPAHLKEVQLCFNDSIVDSLISDRV